MTVWPILMLTVLAATLSVVLGNWLKESNGSIWVYVATSGWIAPLSWALMAKYSPWPLLVSAAVWDLTYEVVWLIVAAILLRNTVNSVQWAGLVVVFSGFAILTVGGNL
jgi:multidrug transporter EmrE-like cation transporter